MIRHYCVVLRQPEVNNLPSYTSISNAAVGNTLYYFVLWPTNPQLFHKLSHCYMFRHYHVILRQPAINNLPGTQVFLMQLLVIKFIILYYDQETHNYFTNYHTATCFDTIVSSSGSLQSIPCQVTQLFLMQLLVIQFIIKMFQISFTQVIQ